MSKVQIIEGGFNASGLKFALVASRFNDFFVEKLTGGAIDTLVRHGADEKDITLAKIPGAFEMPLMAKKLAESGKYDGVICLGAVIRGSTPHFDYVSAEVSKGLAQISLSSGVPVGFGVLTTDTLEQAVERSGTKAGNKGAEAAMATLEMVNALKAAL